MSLEIGQEVRSEIGNQSYTISKVIGEGGQGIVYLLKNDHEMLALKWYNYEQATLEQEKAIRELVDQGPPLGIAGKRFIWPLDIVKVKSSTSFGYLMRLIDTSIFAELGEIWSRYKPVPNLQTLCEISYQLAHSYKALHGKGYCYRDISRGNMLFDPLSGEVLICDNDNVGVFGHSKCQIWGTLDYMAPELVLGNTNQPSTQTDLHSLAVLLFLLWIWHHPLHGEMEYNIRMWDLPAKKRIYGQDPVFIFDQKDLRNRLPNDPDYRLAEKRWALCPSSLKVLFIKAFTVGLRDLNQRVTDGEWCKVFQQLKDGSVECNQCKGINLWENSGQQLTCWNCNSVIIIPPRIIIHQSTGSHFVILNRGTKIYGRHLDIFVNDKRFSEEVAQIVQNPDKPEVWGIRNLSSKPWVATFIDGKHIEILPQKAVPLNLGLKLLISGILVEITE
jgi:serine/threonine protein kinase